MLPVGALTGGRWYVGVPESRGNIFYLLYRSQCGITDRVVRRIVSVLGINLYTLSNHVAGSLL